MAGKYHIEYAPSKKCPYCKGHDGKPKTLYPTESAARDTAYYRQQECGVVLETYPCPHGNGFHNRKSRESPSCDIPRSGANWNFVTE